MPKRNRSIATIAIACLLLGLTPLQADEHEHEDMPTFGVARVLPTQGNSVRGMILLQQDEDQLRIRGRVINLTPGKHGFHIHEFGDPRGPDGTATGGHYDPEGHEHGALDEESHAGDFGNITADENGVAPIDITTSKTKLHFVLGRAFIIHAEEDDLSTQPTGDAGGRVAVGVIGIGNPEYEVPRRNGRRSRD